MTIELFTISIDQLNLIISYVRETDLSGGQTVLLASKMIELVKTMKQPDRYTVQKEFNEFWRHQR